MSKPAELFDAIEAQETDLFTAAGGDSTHSVRCVYDELVEAEETLEQATADDDTEAAKKAQQECERLAGELDMLLDGLEVDLHNMVIDVGALREMVSEGYTFSDAEA